MQTSMLNKVEVFSQKYYIVKTCVDKGRVLFILPPNATNKDSVNIEDLVELGFAEKKEEDFKGIKKMVYRWTDGDNPEMRWPVRLKFPWNKEDRFYNPGQIIYSYNV